MLCVLLTVTSQALLRFGPLCVTGRAVPVPVPAHVLLRTCAWVFAYGDCQVSVQEIVSSVICEILFSRYHFKKTDLWERFLFSNILHRGALAHQNWSLVNTYLSPT